MVAVKGLYAAMFVAAGMLCTAPGSASEASPLLEPRHLLDADAVFRATVRQPGIGFTILRDPQSMVTTLFGADARHLGLKGRHDPPPPG